MCDSSVSSEQCWQAVTKLHTSFQADASKGGTHCVHVHVHVDVAPDCPSALQEHVLQGGNWQDEEGGIPGEQRTGCHCGPRGRCGGLQERSVRR